MIINHKYKFIFVHVWKTGGTSVENSLLTLKDKGSWTINGRGPTSKDFDKHITLPELRNQLSTKYYSKQKPSFSILNAVDDLEGAQIISAAVPVDRRSTAKIDFAVIRKTTVL